MKIDQLQKAAEEYADKYDDRFEVALEEIVMDEFNFKSQRATTIEQSERLIALGLRKEFADMTHHYLNSIDSYELKDIEFSQDRGSRRRAVGRTRGGGAGSRRRKR